VIEVNHRRQIRWDSNTVQRNRKTLHQSNVTKHCLSRKGFDVGIDSVCKTEVLLEQEACISKMLALGTVERKSCRTGSTSLLHGILASSREKCKSRTEKVGRAYVNMHQAERAHPVEDDRSVTE
jgi:hypothetical protein